MRIILLCACLTALPVSAQTNTPTHQPDQPVLASSAATNNLAAEQAVEAMRTECIKGRRTICGRIIKVLHGGLIVDSGYTNLMRHPLDRSWLIPGTVEAERDANMIEKNEPDCVCVGLVYLTDLPKSRRTKPKVLDYVVLHAFPAGHFTYNSVGTTERTVRHFSASLPIAVKLDLQVGQK